MSDQEIEDQLKSSREELFNLRFQLATRQLKNYRQINSVRHKIAMLLTVKRERELGINV